MENAVNYTEFLNKLQKKGSKPHRLTHCRGSRDAWKWVRKNKWKALGGTPCDQSLYSKIIDTVNKYLIEQLFEGHEIEFPHQMGTMRVTSFPSRIYMKDGEIVTNYRTDWKKTLELWYADEEARNTHKPIKKVTRRKYHIKYDKHKARYSNRRFYTLRLNRSLSRSFWKAVEEGKIVAERVEILYNNSEE